MRTLFFRMFVWLWAAVLLLGLTFTGVVLLTSFRSVRNHRAAFQTPLVLYTQAAAATWEQSGATGLAALRNEASAEDHLYFFNGQLTELESLNAPDEVRSLAATLLRQSASDPCSSNDGWLACKASIKDGTLFVAVVNYHFPFRGLIFSLKEWGLVPPALILVTGLVCFWMARYLTRPISRLRWLTGQFAGGDLAVRIEDLSAFQHSEELRGLATDFNRMAQRIQHLVEHQQQLLWDIAHELRTPLTRIALAIGLARQRTPAVAAKEFERIDREIERVDTLLGQLLTIARLESSGHIVDREHVDLSGLVQETISDATLEISERNITIQAQCDEPIMMHGNRELLRVAIENVLRNALRHTGSSSIVDVQLLKQESFIELVVRDRGPGVSESDLLKLFDPFFRTESTRAEFPHGTGLGLTLTKRVVENHGGSIGARNHEKGGLVVKMCFPCGSAFHGEPFSPLPARFILN